MINQKMAEIDTASFFGPLYPYVQDDSITDIDFNGSEAWLTDCDNNRYRAEDISLSDDFIEQFTRRVSNIVSKPFHKMNPVLEAETDTLRITIVHEDVCQGRRCVCIRKSLPRVRLTEVNAVAEGYATLEIMALLKNCIRAGMNIVFTGNPGAGKTECARFFSNFIPGNQRVITLEDTPEWHYKSMNPDKDCVELTVGKNMNYTDAIKTCMRLNPNWLFLAEVRSVEVLSLIECFSTGVKGLTTLHTDDVRNVPDRILNMAGQKREESRLLNDIYTFIDAAVLVKRKEFKNDSGRTVVKRYIDQICFFSREGMENRLVMLVEDGRVKGNSVPESIMRRFEEAGIYEPFSGKQGPRGREEKRPDLTCELKTEKYIFGDEMKEDELECGKKKEDKSEEDELECGIDDKLFSETGIDGIIGNREAGRGMTYRGKRNYVRGA